MNGSQEEQVDTGGALYPENAAPDRIPTAEEIQALAAELEVPVEIPEQLRALAKDLDAVARVLERGPGEPNLKAAAEIQRKIGQCLRMVAMRVQAEAPDA